MMEVTAMERSWRDRARCATDDLLANADWHVADPDEQEWLAGECRTCPVMAECLMDALRSETPNEAFGVRGGLTADQRMDLIRERARMARNASRRKVAA